MSHPEYSIFLNLRCTSPYLQSPSAPRKRRHTALGEEDGMASSYKKHRSHREHRTHSSRLGKRGRGGRVEGGGGEGKTENTIAKTLEEKHKKSRQLPCVQCSYN